MRDIEKKLYKTKPVLINKLIYQAGYDYFNLNGTKYDVSLPLYIDDKNFAKYGYKTKAKFEIILFIKKPLDNTEIKRDFQVIFQKFSDYLDTYMPEYVKQDVQKELFKGRTAGRVKKYNKDAGQSYNTSNSKDSNKIDDDYTDVVIGDNENWMSRYK